MRSPFELVAYTPRSWAEARGRRMVDPSRLCSAAMMGAERAVPWKERRLRPSPVAAPVCDCRCCAARSDAAESQALSPGCSIFAISGGGPTRLVLPAETSGAASVHRAAIGTKPTSRARDGVSALEGQADVRWVSSDAAF
jgi:hypothetical protein